MSVTNTFRPPSATASGAAVLHRKCGCGTHSAHECESCRQKKAALQRSALSSSTAPAGAPPIVHDVLSSPGQPLDAGARAVMEPRFGRDFSSVRVHTDTEAAASARAVEARAYTVGRHVVFADGQYSSKSPEGLSLLAHELTHVSQQGATSAIGDTLPIDSSAQSEGPAEAAARSVLEGTAPDAAASTLSPRVQRAPCPPGHPAPISGINRGIWEVAELWAVEQYPQSNAGCVLTNNTLVEDIHGKCGGYRQLLDAMFTGFRTSRERDSRPREGETKRQRDKREQAKFERELVLSQKVDWADEGGSYSVDDVGEYVADEVYSLFRPDIIDIKNGKVYDVTTVKQAPKKKHRIQQYVNLLNTIADTVRGSTHEHVPTFEAGKRFKPGNITLPNGNTVCFDRTDHAKWPGVVAYDLIETPANKKKREEEEKKKKAEKEEKEKKKKEKEEEKKRKQEEKKKQAEEKKQARERKKAEREEQKKAEQERKKAEGEKKKAERNEKKKQVDEEKAKKKQPKAGSVADDVAEKAVKKEIAPEVVGQPAKQVVPEAAEHAAKQVAPEAAEAARKIVASEAVEKAAPKVKQFLLGQFRDAAGKAIVRIAATKAATRVASLIPVAGWAFSAYDFYNAAIDVSEGHVLRGIGGMSCAVGDVASDALHIADVVTGPGGTAASIGLQTALITCQVSIEVARLVDQMQALQDEIATSGQLPDDARLKEHYGLDDDAVRELRDGFAAAQSEG